MEHEELWQKILKDIKKEVSTGVYTFFFKDSALIKIEENIATIGMPYVIRADMIKKKYMSHLSSNFSKHYGKSVNFSFVAHTLYKLEPIKHTPLFDQIPSEPKKTLGHLPRVRADFTFETLAVSDSNRLAFESAKKVSQNLGGTYNPLFMYGPVGVGKTHLMQAIANHVYGENPSLKIIYITSEEFTNEVVEAIKTADTAKMKRRFRTANLLIIDDVQFIAGKDRVQEELFHTFNFLIDSGAQIALSSDRPPQEIKKLEARLSSRFSGGLTVDIEPPDFEMRTAIILKKAEQSGFTIPIDVAKVVAEKEQDVRALEGALKRIVSEAATKGKDISAEFAERTLNNNPQPKTLRIHSDDIIQQTCVYYNVKKTQLTGPKRQAFLVRARQVSMYLLKKEMGLPLEEIGNILGGRDHTTIMHGVEKVEIMRKEIPALNEEILGITKMLRG